MSEDTESRQEFYERLIAAEEPKVKKARKIYDKWVADFVPMYILSDTPDKKPGNWDDSNIWTRIEGMSESWMTNGFHTLDNNDDDNDFDFVTGYVFTEKPFTKPRLTSRIVSTTQTECTDCDSVEEDETCYVCDDTGFRTIDFEDAYTVAHGWKPGPQFFFSVDELPDPPTRSASSTLSTKANFCTECGNRLDSGVKFCSGCGTAVG